jgi:hypothetical protein
VSEAIAADPCHLLNGEGYRALLGVALEAFAGNPDRLVAAGVTDPGQQPMAQVIAALVGAANRTVADGRRNVLSGPALVEAVRIALGAVSGNADAFRKNPEIVGRVADRLLRAVSEELANDLDGPALTRVLGPILRQTLASSETLERSDAELVFPVLRAVA